MAAGPYGETQGCLGAWAMAGLASLPYGPSPFSHFSILFIYLLINSLLTFNYFN
jgi:hypothetical protein